MCVAVPGKLIEINGDMGTVDFSGNTIVVNISLINTKIGDYLLVHAGCALEVLKKEKAEELIAIFAELQEVMDA
jgi:hydrogenase expression/formation protein HypC